MHKPENGDDHPRADEDDEPEMVHEPADQIDRELNNIFRWSDDEDEEAEISEQAPLIEDSNAPTDGRMLNYVVFWILGMGTLLPWNFFISVNGFWDYKFREVNLTHMNDASDDDDDDDKTELQKEFASFLAIASNVPNAIFVIANALVGQQIKLKYRIFCSLSIVILLFTIVSSLSLANSDTWQREFMDLILLLVVFINCCTAIFQGALFGVAGKFPPAYISAVMAGQAMGGIFPALVDILVKVLRVEEKNVGFACFITATAFLVVCVIGFAFIRKKPFFKYYSNALALRERTRSTDLLSSDRPPSPPSPIASRTVFQVIQRSWQFCLTTFVVFTTTLAVFPAVTVLIESEHRDVPKPSRWAVKYFTTVTCFLLFNSCDYIGRLVAAWLLVPGRTLMGKNITLLLALARVTFIPIFMFCNAAPAKRSLPIYFHSDLSYIFFMTVFALSNGYLGNLCMIHGPKMFIVGADQELCAMVLVAFLVLGTSCGSFLSYPLVNII